MSWLISLLLVGNIITLNVVDMPSLLNELAMCESSLNPKAYVANDGGSESIGLFQFKTKTFECATKRYNLKGLDIWNPEHQKIVATKLLEEGRHSHWKVCGTKLKLGEIIWNIKM